MLVLRGYSILYEEKWEIWIWNARFPSYERKPSFVESLAVRQRKLRNFLRAWPCGSDSLGTRRPNHSQRWQTWYFLMAIHRRQWGSLVHCSYCFFEVFFLFSTEAIKWISNKTGAWVTHLVQYDVGFCYSCAAWHLKAPRMLIVSAFGTSRAHNNIAKPTETLRGKKTVGLKG